MNNNTKNGRRNNFPVLHPIFELSSPVLRSQKLKMERLFLHFCSLKTDQYKPNLSATQERDHAPIPNHKSSRLSYCYRFLFLGSFILTSCAQGPGSEPEPTDNNTLTMGVVTDNNKGNLNELPANIVSKFIQVNTDRAINDQYIVVLKNQYVDKQVFNTFGEVSINSTNALNYRRVVVENTVTEMANIHSATVKAQYDTALVGFAAQMTAQDMRALLADDRVAYIEQDQIISANITQNNATQGLDRIDQANLPLNSQYSYDFDGSGVRAYVIDTGIFVGHTDFGGRAENGQDFVDNDNIANDCNGHGTHVAGTIGSSTYGVAKNVTLVAVRVLGCDGLGINSIVIKGVDWIAQNAVRPAVANMSLGGLSSRALDTAVENAINRGIIFVAAAGNNGHNNDDNLLFPPDACNISPSRVPNVLTIASSGATDARSFNSNWGTCVDLFAPGSNIVSTWNDGNVVTLSGTSMSTPHVAGVAALYLQNNPSASPATVNVAIVNNAVSGKITDTRGSPNRLLQSTFNVSTPPPSTTPPIPPTETLEKAGRTPYFFGDDKSKIVNYIMRVPAGTSDLSFNLHGNGRGPQGDVALYVKFGSAPKISLFDCASSLKNSFASCNFPSPKTGTYYIMLVAKAKNSIVLIGDYMIRGGNNNAFFENVTNTNIPDNNSTGAPSDIEVVRDVLIGPIEISVDIKHTYIGDLIVELYWPNGLKSTLQSHIGGARNNLFKTFTQDPGNRNPAVATGNWQLRVKDMVSGDTGFIDSWSITFK